MTQETEKVNIWSKISELEINFLKSYKCINKTAVIKRETVEYHTKILYENLEEIRKQIFENSNRFEKSEHALGKNKFIDLKDKLTKILTKYNIKEKVTITLDSPIIYNLEQEDFNTENKQIDLKMSQTPTEFLGLASKLLPEFDGGHESIAVLLIKTKLRGAVQNIIANEKSIDAIIEKLKTAIRTESVESITAKLYHTQQNTKSVTEYAKEVEDLTHALENAYINDGLTTDLATRYATQTAVKALIKGANNDRTKIIMEAGQFSNINLAVTKFVSSSTNTNMENNNVFYYGNKQQSWNQNYNRNRGQNSYSGRGYGRGSRNIRGRRRQFYNGERVQQNQYFPSTNRQNNRNIRFISEEESKNLEAPLDAPQQD